MKSPALKGLKASSMIPPAKFCTVPERAIPTAKPPAGLFHGEICSLAFDNPQGLGGHMSGVHRDASLKYKKKRETRNKRFEIRKMNNLSKKILCLKHKVNYMLKQREVMSPLAPCWSDPQWG